MESSKKLLSVSNLGPRVPGRTGYFPYSLIIGEKKRLRKNLVLPGPTWSKDSWDVTCQY